MILQQNFDSGFARPNFHGGGSTPQIVAPAMVDKVGQHKLLSYENVGYVSMYGFRSYSQE
jgi:hypothetical protein